MEEKHSAQPTESLGSEDNSQEKEKKIEEERTALLNRVVSGNIVDVKDRVAFILNSSNEARNSDNDLAWSYWETFEADILNKGITRETMQELTKQNSLIRFRAKIQNEYKLFQADPVVRKYRGMLQDTIKEEVLEDKPPVGAGFYQVYIDETGKTQDYLSVGSLWILNYGRSVIRRTDELSAWKKQRNINFEFHFTEVSKAKVPLYVDFFTTFLSKFPEVGFKLIVASNKGLSDKNKAITDLTYHLVSKGIDHENSSGRAPLPRVLNVWLDEDEKGSDQIKLENIKERLTNRKLEGLHLRDFQAVQSTNNFFIQAVDLFTASVNRKLHNPAGTHFKDELADAILGLVKFDIRDVDKENTDADKSKIFDLGFATDE